MPLQTTHTTIIPTLLCLLFAQNAWVLDTDQCDPPKTTMTNNEPVAPVCLAPYYIITTLSVSRSHMNRIWSDVFPFFSSHIASKSVFFCNALGKSIGTFVSESHRTLAPKGYRCDVYWLRICQRTIRECNLFTYIYSAPGGGGRRPLKPTRIRTNCHRVYRLYMLSVCGRGGGRMCNEVVECDVTCV